MLYSHRMMNSRQMTNKYSSTTRVQRGITNVVRYIGSIERDKFLLRDLYNYYTVVA